MSELREQQIEALQVSKEYCGKIITAMNKIVDELTGEKLPDTDEYMNHIINGLNWIFEVFNGTKDLINENGVIVDKDVVNQSVVKLNNAIKDNDDAAKAEAIKELLEFVEKFKAEAEKY